MNSFPDTACKSPAKDTPEGWSNSSGDNKDNAEDLSAGDCNRCGPSALGPEVISEDVGDDEEGGLEHDGKCLNEESENPREVAVKGTGWFVSTRAEGSRVQVHDRISFEGSLGKYGKESDKKGSCKTAENDCGDCGGGCNGRRSVRSSRE